MGLNSKFLILNYWKRLIISVVLGLFIGAEVILYGYNLLNLGVLIPLLLLYVLLFALSDDLIARFDLRDRDLFIFGIILAFIIGGIISEEMYETD